VQTLVEMWSAEGLLIRRGITNLMDVGRQYIDALVGRCLIEYVGVKKIQIDVWVEVEKEVIKVHDVLRDTAIYIGERDEHWVFASGQHLQNFPREEVTRNCKRLSVGHNDIEELPTDLECTELLSLILANCPKLRKVPAASFLNIMSLKVLDLSRSLITSLPTSVGQLGQLEFLNLTGCYLLNELPETICSLFRLQFLNLDFCQSLVSLPDNIGDLKSLKHFSFHLVVDPRSVVFPCSIFGLTSLTKLCLPSDGPPGTPGCAISMEDLINLSNLMELSIAVKAHTMSNCDWTWLKMRKLVLQFEHDANARRDAAAKADSNVAVDDGDNVVVKDADGDEDDVVEDAVMLDTLPLENMNELQTLSLIEYRGLSLPNYICKFQNLEELQLLNCPELRELPVLEIGSDSASDSFPMLKKLLLWELDKLESIANVLNGGAMSKLQYFEISGCPLLKRLPIGIEKLCNLKEISGEKDWWSNIIWEDEATRVKLQPLFRDR
jgi:disease resistance protein RPS2